MRHVMTGILTITTITAFVLAGCLEESEPVGGTAYPVVGCSASEDCPPDAFCEDGFCVPACAADADCPDGAACIAGVCDVAVEAFDCLADADCPVDSFCMDGICVYDGGDCIDADGDGFGLGCGAPDCDDADPSIGPAAPEVCDGIDNDCDGMVDEECGCDPAAEICDGLDNDCDGVVDEGCGGGCASDADCDDGDPATADICLAGVCTHDATCADEEICDGLDNDCDGEIDEGCSGSCTDADGDGYGFGASCAGFDCDDMDPSINPAAVELCDDLDNDCDGEIDEGCGGAACASDADCDDGDPATIDTCMDGLCVHGGADSGCDPAPEICDGLDNDCDGVVDEGC